MNIYEKEKTHSKTHTQIRIHNKHFTNKHETEMDG